MIFILARHSHHPRQHATCPTHVTHARTQPKLKRHPRHPRQHATHASTPPTPPMLARNSHQRISQANHASTPLTPARNSGHPRQHTTSVSKPPTPPKLVLFLLKRLLRIYSFVQSASEFETLAGEGTQSLKIVLRKQNNQFSLLFLNI